MAICVAGRAMKATDVGPTAAVPPITALTLLLSAVVEVSVGLNWPFPSVMPPLEGARVLFEPLLVTVTGTPTTRLPELSFAVTMMVTFCVTFCEGGLAWMVERVASTLVVLTMRSTLCESEPSLAVSRNWYEPLTVGVKVGFEMVLELKLTDAPEGWAMICQR